MVIDIHTHTFPDKIAAAAVKKLSGSSHTEPFSDGTNEGLLQTMEEAAIDLSVILPVATSPEQVKHINDSAARINEEYFGKGLFSFGAIHPDCINYRDEIKRIADLGLKGVKIHPVYQGTALDDLRYLRIFDLAAELDLLIVTHAGLDIGYPGVELCSPEMALNAVEEIGEFKFILAHMGGWRNWDRVLKLLPDTGVYLDTSFSTGVLHPLNDGYYEGKNLDMLNSEGFMELLRAFSPERLLFGTDSPWSLQREERSFIEALPVSDRDKKLILGGNAEKLLGFTFPL